VNPGLLQSVRKYRPRAGNDPLENFVTEAFCWVLNNCGDFGQKFAEEMANRTGLEQFDATDCKWLTQVNFSGVYPDMVCETTNSEGGTSAIVFEHKVWSSVHKGQIHNYKAHASNCYTESKTVLITANTNQHVLLDDNSDERVDDSASYSMCWRDVYEFISNNKNENPGLYCPLTDFQQFLKSEGLGPAAPISHEGIKYFYTSYSLRQDLSDLMRRAIDEENNDWAQNLRGELILDMEKDAYTKERWGRIGLSLNNTNPQSWAPKIFVGIILDYQDLRTKPMDERKGPDFSLLLIFPKQLYRTYTSNPNYLTLLSNIQSHLEEMGAGWELHNHHDDPGATRNINKHVPFHIRKPMLDVFAGTETPLEQQKVFCKTARRLVDLVVDNDCYWKLRQYIDSDRNTDKAA